MRMLRAVLAPMFVAAAVVLGAPTASFAQIGVSVSIAPPILPVYAQPPIPGPGYLWNPGFWGWGAAGYYWVPGTWALPPRVGLLWTPGYWGWGGAGFAFHAGFWGPTVGFYGGINYGFGFGGVGFAGGYWRNGAFFYNRSVTNISNTRITNVYNRNVTVNRTTNVSFNGGAGGTTARPTAAELAAERQPHVAPTAAQVQHQQAASSNRALLASENHGNPAIAATARPGEFTGRGVEAARGATPAAAAGQRPAAGAEHRPAGTAAAHPAHPAYPAHPVHPAYPAHPAHPAQEHRPAPAQAHPGTPQKEMQRQTPQQRAAMAGQRRPAQERAAHEPAGRRPQE